mmetsp:Transcript_3256/g.9271  ORF Transcript_3256/g.9271 Transcript_3256/m.9271 type:complete len:200 (-) Transcript_3256:3642-4241(-)
MAGQAGRGRGAAAACPAAHPHLAVLRELQGAPQHRGEAGHCPHSPCRCRWCQAVRRAAGRQCHHEGHPSSGGGCTAAARRALCGSGEVHQQPLKQPAERPRGAAQFPQGLAAGHSGRRPGFKGKAGEAEEGGGGSRVFGGAPARGLCCCAECLAPLPALLGLVLVPCRHLDSTEQRRHPVPAGHYGPWDPPAGRTVLSC